MILTKWDSFHLASALADRLVKGVVKYEVKWQGYDENENTWEPEENLV